MNNQSESLPEVAYTVHQRVVALKKRMAGNFIEMGTLLKRIRDDKLYRQLDCETFTEYLGQPELAIRRSAAYDSIRVIELYLEKLQVPEERLLNIGTSKLKIIAPVVENNPEEYLALAEHNSRSDLTQEVRGAQTNKLPSEENTSLNKNEPLTSYYDYVKNHPCILCGKKPSFYAHFPRTKGRGQFGIPLCQDCHAHSHDIGNAEFMRYYSEPIEEYFSELVRLIWSYIDEKGEK